MQNKKENTNNSNQLEQPENLFKVPEVIVEEVQQKTPVPEWIKSNAAWWGEGNIDSPAGFLDPGVWIDPNTPLAPEDDYFNAGNYHITPASPCYQAGDSNSLPAESITDLDGQPRVLDNRVEMGSDEVFTHPMDFNLSGRVDLWDLSLFFEQWLTGDDGMDFNTDDIVDLEDYASFALAWNWTAQWKTD